MILARGRDNGNQMRGAPPLPCLGVEADMDATDIAKTIIRKIIAAAEKEHQVELDEKTKKIIEDSTLTAVEDIALEEAVWYTGLGMIPDIPAIDDDPDIRAFIEASESEMTEILNDAIDDNEYPDTEDTRHRLSVVIADRIIRAIIKEAKGLADYICREEKEGNV